MSNAEPRYLVGTEFRAGERTVIMRTNDYAKAASTCNFWDERQNSWFTDLHTLTPLEDALRRLDMVQTKMNKNLDEVSVKVTPSMSHAARRYR